MSALSMNGEYVAILQLHCKVVIQIFLTVEKITFSHDFWAHFNNQRTIGPESLT